MADDPVGNAVREARWSVLERFARVAKFTREIAGTTEVSEPEVGDARIVGTSNSDTPQTRPTFSPARIHLARWAYAWRRVRARDAQLRLNQPPPSLDDIEGLSASYSILAASALDDGGSTVWDETGEVETDLGTFEVWSTDQTPPSQTVSRTAPLSAAEWNAFFDSKTGRIVVSEKDIRKRIFSGGLGLEIRAEAWKFLLGMYPWDSTASERAVIRESKAEQYRNLKVHWQDVIFNPIPGTFPAAEMDAFNDSFGRIEKDVVRTDRSHPFYTSDPARVTVLRDVLTTYACGFERNEGVAFCQGMADLASPILIVMDGDEIDTFWCFAGFMEYMKPNFHPTGAGMHSTLSTMSHLINLFFPFLSAHLAATDSSDLFFCFRWFLVWFRRELRMDKCMRLWEVFWTCDDGGKAMVLFFALAVLDEHKDVVCRFLGCFDEVLKYINDLTQTVPLEPTLERAGLLYLRFQSRAIALGCLQPPEKSMEMFGIPDFKEIVERVMEKERNGGL